MEPDYGAAYRELYDKHWWWRARESLILSTLAELRPNRSWGSILDIGCGDGLFFERLRELGEIQGIEPDPSLVRPDSPWRDRIYFGEFDDSFQPTKSFGLILMLDVLEHFTDPAGALRRAAKLLEPKGLLVITVPAFRALWTSHDVLNRHFDRYSKKTFSRLAEGVGVRVQSWRYFSHWTALAKLAVRVKEVLFSTAPRVPRVPPYWINQTLFVLSRLEQKVLGRLPMTPGSSLLVVAEKASRDGCL